MTTYPIELDLSGRTVLVVGLGTVGRRKASGLVEAGARVLAVDPAARMTLEGVELRAEFYRPEHLAGASLAFAAATAEVNRRVTADARLLKIWVNSASEPEEGDFALPAVWQDGPLILTVSTSGASPALSSVLRDRAAAALGPAAAGLASVLQELRPEVLQKFADPGIRRRILAEAAAPRWLDLLAKEGPEAVRSALRAILGLDPGK
jgi:precorrin-2 dehydrogenase/sirohydrochlorin ferrochelatase